MSARLLNVFWSALLITSHVTAADYRPPRLPDGQVDLQGVWSHTNLTPLERPADLKSFVITPEQAAATVAVEDSQPAKPLSLALDEERDPRHPRRNLRIWASVGAAVVAVGVGVTLGVLLTKGDPAAEKPVPGDAGVLTWK